MASATKAQPRPDDLVAVIWADSGESVTLPRRLLQNGSKAAQERYLLQSGQLATESPLPPMEEPAVIISDVRANAEVSALEQRVAALESRPAPILPSEQSLAAWSQQAARVGLAHSELAALTDQTVATVEAVAEGATQRLDALDAGQQAMTEAVAQSVSDGQEAVSQAIIDLGQQGAAAINQIEADAQATATNVARDQATIVATEVANQHWGSSVTIAPEDPSKTDGSSWAQRWYGRPNLIPGDGAFVVGASGITAMRYTGQRWEKTAELSPKTELINQQLQIEDRSTKLTSITSYNLGGSGGSGGGEKLLINRITRAPGATGALPSVLIADTSNWAGTVTEPPAAGQLVLDILALDGSLAGRRGFAVVDFAWQPSGGQFTVNGNLGELTGLVDVNLTIQRSPASVPPGLTGITLPVGAMATKVFLNLVEIGGGGGTGTGGPTTSWRIAGDIEWAIESLGQARALNDISNPKPLWIWA